MLLLAAGIFSAPLRLPLDGTKTWITGAPPVPPSAATVGNLKLDT